MPILDKFERLRLADIHVHRDERQRREIVTDDLEGSIRIRGVLQPIIVETEVDGLIWLISGERRLETSRKLGLADIPARFAHDLSPIERQIFELEENVKRKDLTWQETARGIQRIHDLYKSLDPEWTLTATAESLGFTKGHVSLYLTVAKEIEQGPIANSATVREAYNRLERRDQRAAGAALEDLIATTTSMTAAPKTIEDKSATPWTPPPSILHQSFLEWAPSYSGPRFNFLHIDFPYGVNLFDGEMGRRGTTGTDHYTDTKDIYFELLDCLCSNLENFFSMSGHMLFWYSAKYDRETKDFFRLNAPTLEFSSHPLIWHKSDNAGIIANAGKDPRHIYETCLLARRGDRSIVKSVGDVYACPTDKTLHPSTKPEPMLRHFMQMLVDPSTTMLDPTCGSGAALRAADSLGAATVLGLEIDGEHVAVAQQALTNSRRIRNASQTLGV